MFIVRATFLAATGITSACYSPELPADSAVSVAPGTDDSNASEVVTTSPKADSDAGTSGDASSTGDTGSDSSAGPDTEELGPSCGAIPTEPTVLASFADNPGQIAVDDEYVYFLVAVPTKEVNRVSKCGGPTVKLADSVGGLNFMALDKDSVYWTTFNQNGSVFKVPKVGGLRVTLATDQAWAASIRVTGGQVCWSQGFTPDIRCVLTSGGDITVVESAPHWVGDFHPFEGYFYWFSYNMPGAVGRVKQAGGALEVILADVNMDRILVDSEHIYLRNKSGHLERMPLNGGPLEPFAESAYHIAQDDETVFWTDYSGGLVRSRSKLGGPVKDIAVKLGNPSRIAIDATHVYWTDDATKAVMVAPR